MPRLWMGVAAASIIWWIFASQFDLHRGVLLVALSLATFAVGCVVGFLLTSYDDERNTLGKLKDTLTGILTAVTITSLAQLKALLVCFAPEAGPNGFGIAFGTAATYFTAGFFFMFLQRELILNIALARTRLERGRIEGSQQTTQVIQRFLLRLPASVMAGVTNIDEVIDVNDEEAKNLRDLIFSDEVTNFLHQAEEAVASGSVDWDIASKSANIYYYRTFFLEKEEGRGPVGKAIEWLVRALNMNPLHVDITMKYAAMLGADDDAESAAAILERLVSMPESPALVKQWLGYYLRFLDYRLDDAIKYSLEYHRQFPSESDTFFNISYAYAAKHCGKTRSSSDAQDTFVEDRVRALSYLKEALSCKPEMVAVVRDEWTKSDAAFHCLASDPEFQATLRTAESLKTPPVAV